MNGPVQRSAYTRSDGTWTISQLPPGVYLVTATHARCAFTPSERRVQIQQRDIHEVNFTAHPAAGDSGGATAKSGGAGSGSGTSTKPAASARRTIGGAIVGLAPGDRAMIEISGPVKMSHYARSDGTYDFQQLKPGVYTVRPVSKHYRFSPTFRTVNVSEGDKEEIHFKAYKLNR